MPGIRTQTADGRRQQQNAVDSPARDPAPLEISTQKKMCRLPPASRRLHFRPGQREVTWIAAVAELPAPSNARA